jgi:hypothetical protein
MGEDQRARVDGPAGHTPLFAAAIVSFAHFLSFPFLTHPIVTDVRFYLYFAAQTAMGAVPHRDFFDSKTPLATLAGAALLELGALMGQSPLTSIRAGYLTLAAVIGVLTFVVHRRLGPAGVISGGLGLAVHLSFPLLGIMPAIGNIPKLLMALLAAVAAVSVGGRRWGTAGAAGALAFLDWQVGGLVLLACFAAALLEGEARAKACRSLAAGAVLGLLPFLLYFGVHGALTEVWSQAVTALASRSSRGAAMHQIAAVVRVGSRGHLWLFVLGAVGMLLYPRYIARAWRGLRAMAVTLGAYHTGVVVFTFWDFQAYGDLYILVHSVAFFAGVGLCEIQAVAGASFSPRRTWVRPLANVVSLGLAVAALRPWVSRASFQLEPLNGHTRITLQDQRTVAARVRAQLVQGTTGVVGPAEQLFLTGTRSPLPFVTWSEPVWTHYRESPGESSAEILHRQLARAKVAVVLTDEIGYPFRREPARYAPSGVERSGEYRLSRFDVLRPDEP